ncbi:MAG: AAA family ATPase, partial [Fimbriimonadales bacterium]
RLAEQLWEAVAPFQQVILALDADGAGERALRELARTCPEPLLERAFVVQPPEPHKDWNELWVSLSGDANAFKAELESLPRRPLAEWRGEQEPLRGVVRLGDAFQGQGDSEREWLPLLERGEWIGRGSIVLLASLPKQGKSTMLATCAAEWAERGEKVLVWSEERLPQWLERVQRMPTLSEVYYAPSSTPLGTVIEAVQRLGISVLVVDTWRGCLGCTDENDARTVLAAVAPLLDLAQEQPRLTQVWAHHLRKSAQADAEVWDFAGSAAITGCVDALIALLPVEREKSARLLKPLSARYWLNPPEALVVEMTPEGVYRVVGVAAEVERELAKRQLHQAIIDTLRLLGESTAAEIHEHLEGQELAVSLRRVRQVLDELVFAGVIHSRGQGTRANPRTYYLPETHDEGNGEIGKSPTHGISFTISPNHEGGNEQEPHDWGNGEISLKFHHFTNPLEGDGVVSEPAISEGNRD